MMPAHNQTLYVDNVGCPAAEVALVEDTIKDASACSLLTDAVWAAMDTYVEASYPLMMATPGLLSYGQKMKSAHWNLEVQWVVVNKTTPSGVASTLFGFMN